MKKIIRLMVFCLCLLGVMNIGAEYAYASNQGNMMLHIEAANPLANRISTYSGIDARKPSGMIYAQQLTRGKENSLFNDIYIYENGMAEIRYYKGNKMYKTYVHASSFIKNYYRELLGNLNVNQLTASEKIDVYTDPSCTKKMFTITRGMKYKQIYKIAKTRVVQIYVKDKAIGWINQGKLQSSLGTDDKKDNQTNNRVDDKKDSQINNRVDDKKDNQTNNRVDDKKDSQSNNRVDDKKDNQTNNRIDDKKDNQTNNPVDDKNNNSTGSIVNNPKKDDPKEILQAQVGNPIRWSIKTYANKTSKQENGQFNADYILRMEGNSKFLDITIYDTGLAEVNYFDQNHKCHNVYVKASDITTADVAIIPNLKQQAAKKKYKLYAQDTLENVIQEMWVGKPYVVLASKQNGNLKQIYTWGKGAYTAIGWIREDGYQKGITGDVNNDKVVDKTDWQLVSDYLEGKNVDINLLNADMNSDGKVDLVDQNKLIIDINKIANMKKILDVALSNPIHDTIDFYKSVTDDKPYKTMRKDSLRELLEGARFLDGEIYNNGFTKVTYCKDDRTSDYMTDYVKTSTIVLANNFTNLEALKTVTAAYDCKLYSDVQSGCEMDIINQGKIYKVIGTSGNWTQVYFKGVGQYSYIGWIKNSSNMKGDVNNDRSVNATDLELLKRYIVDHNVEIDLNNADINNDGKITSTDVSRLVSMLNPKTDNAEQTENEDSPVVVQPKLVYPTNGIYSLQPKCAPDKELTVEKASATEGANVFIYAIASDRDNQPSHQKWIITRLGNSQWYKIETENGGLALNVHNGISADGTNVTLWPYGGNMHEYCFFDLGDGYYAIQARVNGAFVLDVTNGGTANETNVAIHTFNGSDAQKWKLVERKAYNPVVKSIANGWYKLVPQHATNSCMDVSDGSGENQVNIQLWQNNDSNAQKFYLQNVGNNYFMLKTGCSDNRYVDAKYGGPNIWQHDKEADSGVCQKFRLLDAGDGTYYLEAKVREGQIIECYAGGVVNGTNIQLGARKRNDYCKWRLVSVSAPIVNDGFDWPLKDFYYVNVRHSYSNGVKHSCRYYSGGKGKKNTTPYGIDIPVRKGTKIYAPASGVVQNKTITVGGFGNCFEIKHDDGTITLYAHLSNSDYVWNGKRVNKGDLIALSGNSGNVKGKTGEHLHFEMSTVDPYEYYRNRGVPLHR